MQKGWFKMRSNWNKIRSEFNKFKRANHIYLCTIHINLSKLFYEHLNSNLRHSPTYISLIDTIKFVRLQTRLCYCMQFSCIIPNPPIDNSYYSPSLFYFYVIVCTPKCLQFSKRPWTFDFIVISPRTKFNKFISIAHNILFIFNWISHIAILYILLL